MRRLISMVVFSSLAACTCEPAKPQRVSIPPTALPVLTSGMLTFPGINNTVLSPIGSSVNNALIFSQEFEKAPGMTAVSLPPASVSAVESLIPNITPIPPIERDLVMCAARELPDGSETPFPTQPFYETPSILFVKPDGGFSFSGAVAGSFGVVQLDHVRGAITNLSLLPDSASTGTTQMLVDGRTAVTSFMLNMTVSQLDVKAEFAGLPVTMNATTVTLSCAGVIAPATTNVPTHYLSCGEQNVRCVSPTVTFNGFSTNVEAPFVPEIAEAALKQALLDAMGAGINLHFQNFAPTSFTFVPGTSSGQTLTLIGNSTVVNGWSPCSPVPPPEPAAGPTRALGRLSATWGSSLQTSSTGRVRFVDLIPEAEMLLDSNSPQALEMLRRTALPRGATTGFTEAPPLDQPVAGPGSAGFLPYGIATQLRIVRHEQECWQEALKIESLEFLQEGRVFTRWNGADGKMAQKGVPRFGDGSMGIVSIEEADFERDLLPLVMELGVDDRRSEQRTRVPIGVDDLKGKQWTRVIIGVGTPLDGPFDPRVPTGFIEIFSELPLPVLTEHFEPQVRCSGEFQEPVKKEERVSDPAVDVGAFKLDSADVVATLLPTSDRRNTFLRSVAGEHVIITLPMTCPAVDAYSPYVSCWKETLTQLPNAGSIAVSKGFSGTTQRTGSLRTETPESLGDRTAAVHGVFDRSSVALYTKVPDDYAPFTSQTWDYHGVITFDWMHAPNFVAPAGHFTHPGYLVAAHRFFANWHSDIFQLRHEGQWPPSNCLLPEMRFAVPTDLVVTEYVGTSQSAVRIANTQPGELSIDGAGAFGDYRVSPGVSRSFSTFWLWP